MKLQIPILEKNQFPQETIMLVETIKSTARIAKTIPELPDFDK